MSWVRVHPPLLGAQSQESKWHGATLEPHFPRGEVRAAHVHPTGRRSCVEGPAGHMKQVTNDRGLGGSHATPAEQRECVPTKESTPWRDRLHLSPWTGRAPRTPPHSIPAACFPCTWSQPQFPLKFRSGVMEEKGKGGQRAARCGRGRSSEPGPQPPPAGCCPSCIQQLSSGPEAQQGPHTWPTAHSLTLCATTSVFSPLNPEPLATGPYIHIHTHTP